MVIGTDISVIEKHFDFTDSIITSINWESNLTSLAISIDYYWDLQEGKEETRVLKLTFKDCVEANFLIRRDILQLSEKIIQRDSLFTIVRFEKTESILGGESGITLHRIRVYTFDYERPWLELVCREVTLEQLD